MVKCSIEGCENPVKSRGWCRTHYMRWYHTGDPLLLKGGRWDGYVRPTCLVGDCGAPAHGLGLCTIHGPRQKRHGDPIAGRRREVSGTPDKRFDQLREINADGCWLCQAASTTAGYGQFHPGDRDGWIYWHQWAYERYVGPIPEGLEIDHVCHNRDFSCEGGACKHRRCGNPDHLEAVSPEINKARGRERRKIHLEHEFRNWVFQ